MTVRGSKRLSDARLKALLKGLREDVAAPRDFRERVLLDLRRQGMLKDAPGALSGRTTFASLLQGLAAWLPARPRLGLALGAALALAFVLIQRVPVSSRRAVQGPAAAADSTRIRPASVSGAGNPALAARGGDAGSARSDGAAPGPRPLMAPAHASTEPATGASVTDRSGSSVAAISAAESKPAVGAPQSGGPSQGSSASAAGAEGGSAPGFAARGAAIRSASAVPAGTPGPQVKPTEVQTTPTPGSQLLGQNSQVRSNIIRASQGQSAEVIFNVTKSGPVLVEIHDRLGRSIAVLENNSLESGQYTLYWNGTADAGGMAASGIYEVRIQTTTYVERHKMLLVK